MEKEIIEIQSSLGEGDQVIIRQDGYQVSVGSNIDTPDVLKLYYKIQDLESRVVNLEEKTPHDYDAEDEGMSRYAR